MNGKLNEYYVTLIAMRLICIYNLMLFQCVFLGIVDVSIILIAFMKAILS